MVFGITAIITTGQAMQATVTSPHGGWLGPPEIYLNGALCGCLSHDQPAEGLSPGRGVSGEGILPASRRVFRENGNVELFSG
jgi:hypothetical protein